MDDEKHRVPTVYRTDPAERRIRELIRPLRKRAVPGNWAWQRIEALQGYDADYSPADHGMHWSDSK